jgi:hypothetical protein
MRMEGRNSGPSEEENTLKEMLNSIIQNPHDRAVCLRLLEQPYNEALVERHP